MDDPSSLRLLQQNCNYSKFVTGRILEYAKGDLTFDLFALQNPHYSYKRTVAEEYSEKEIRIFEGCRKEGQIALSSVVVLNPELKVYMVPELLSNRCVCVTIEDKNEAFNIVSMYCPLSLSADELVQEFRRVVKVLGPGPAIYCIASSGRFTPWSRTNDDRGRKLHQAISELPSLKILNTPLPTRALDFTDLTVTTTDLYGRMTHSASNGSQESLTRRTILIGISFD